MEKKISKRKLATTYFLLFFILSFLSIIAFKTSTYIPRKGESILIDDSRGALDYYIKTTANQITGRVDLKDVEAVRNSIEALANSRLQSSLNLAWQEVGPDNVGGRTRALMLDKDSVNVMYAGGVAGGLWKSVNGGTTWNLLFDKFENNAISCITQAANGDIYVGTGEGHYYGFGTKGRGMIGSGIWKSTNRGSTWFRLSSTIPTTLNSTVPAFAYVNEVASSPLNSSRIYASTNAGLRMSDDGGQSWINPIHTPEAAQGSGDVKVGTDGTVIASIDGHAYLSPNGNDSSFISISGTGTGDLPVSGTVRLEFAFAPTDNNYIYTSISSNDGGLFGVYQSKDKGLTWNKISIASADPLYPQGEYDNCIVVSSVNPNKIFVAGTRLYTCSASTIPASWASMSVQYPGSQDQFRYVHPDMHVLLCDPTNPQVLYIANDGGIFKTSNVLTPLPEGPSFTNLNKGYNVTQFYAISPTAKGEVVGGAQDNGTIYINNNGGSSQSSIDIGGGDGCYTEASFIFPKVVFSSSQSGNLARTFSPTNSGTQFFSKRIENMFDTANSAVSTFVTTFVLNENFNDTLTKDSVDYIIKPTDNTSIGGVLQITSRVAGFNAPNRKFFDDTNKVVRNVGDTIRVKDILQSKLAIGFVNSVWLTKQAINEGGPVNWMRIGYSSLANPAQRFTGTSKILRFSKDGDYLYVGTLQGSVYRFSNLKSITYADTLTGEIGNPKCQIECKKILTFPSRAICGIAIDPNNNDKVVVTLGNYGNTDYVYMTDNATAAAPLFLSKQNNLPKMPVYDVVIDMNNTNTILIGTEYGVWNSDDNGANWSQSTSFPYVPVFSLRQQIFPYSTTVSHTGEVFAGTHGRGAWKTNSLVGIKNISTSKTTTVPTLSVAPNPSRDLISLQFQCEKSTASIKIYSLQGKLIQAFELENLALGENNFKFSVLDFDAGIYIASINSEKKQSVAKFIVVK